MLNKDYFDILIKKAKEIKKDIPICALITYNNEIISIQTNKKEENNQTIAHAEILAIQEANKKLNSWRLKNCSMYVTLEPCPMCAWAILNSKIKNLYFGSYDLQYGGFSVLKLEKLANSKINIVGGIKEKECDEVLKNYFQGLRNEK